MTVNRERQRRGRDQSWFARQLGEGWVSAGDGIYYPPEPNADEPEPLLAAAADAIVPEPSEAARLPHRRRELASLRERLVERVSRFPNPVAERQLRELEQELATVARKLRGLPFAGQH